MSDVKLSGVNEQFKNATAGFSQLDYEGQVKFTRRVNEHPTLNNLDQDQLRDFLVEAIDNGRSYQVQQSALDLAFNLEERNMLPKDEKLNDQIMSKGVHFSELHQYKTIKLASRLIEDGELDDINEIMEFIVKACNRKNSDYIKVSAIDLVPVAIENGILLDDSDMQFLNDFLNRVEFEMASGESVRSYSDKGRFMIEQYINKHGFNNLPQHSIANICDSVMAVQGLDDDDIDKFIDRLSPPAEEGRYNALGDSIRSRWSVVKNARNAQDDLERTFSF